MTARTEIQALLSASAAALQNDPIQQMNLIAGDDETYNQNQIFARINAIQQALLLLADKIDSRP